MLNGWGSIIPRWFLNPNWEVFPSKETFDILMAREIEYVLIHRYLMLRNELEDFDRRMELCQILCENLLFVENIGDVDIYKIIQRK